MWYLQAIPEIVRSAASLAGSVVLLLMLVALGAFAYRSLVGGGIEWPDDRDGADADDDVDGVTRSDDDEWKYS